MKVVLEIQLALFGWIVLWLRIGNIIGLTSLLILVMLIANSSQNSNTLELFAKLCGSSKDVEFVESMALKMGKSILH